MSGPTSSASEPFLSVRAGVKEKGGAPEDARQGKIDMHTVLQSRPAGNRAQPISAGFHTESATRKLGIWLDSLVEMSKKRPVSQIVSLTPTLAEVLLNRNPSNRRVSERIVETYAHEIAAGTWAFNGEPIIISDTGELNDGQHRCRGVIEAGRAIDVILIVGVKRSTRLTLDRGRARTVGDYLAMNGLAYGNVLGAAANLVWQFRSRGFIGRASRASATKSEVLALIEENPGLGHSVEMVHVKGADAVGGKTVLAACHFILSGVARREDADWFILSLINGAGLKVGDPALYVRNRLINDRGRVYADEKVELILKAWNASRRGEKVARMILTGGVIPALEA